MRKSIFQLGMVGIVVILLGAGAIGTTAMKNQALPQKTSLTDGLVAYWSFNDPANPGKDDSGNHYDGTVMGATWTANGEVKGALSFDGINNYVQVNSPVANTPPYSVCAWVKSMSMTDGDHYIISNGGQTKSSYGFCLLSDETYLNGKWRLCLSNSAGMYRDCGITPSATTWTFLVATWDGSSDPSQVKFYENGELKATGTPHDWNTGSPQNLRIGASSNSLLAKFHGLIDEVRVYNRVISPDEITALNNIIVTTVQSGIGPTVLIKNNGTNNAMNVHWQITVKGGLLGAINKTKSDVIASMTPGQEVTVGTGLFLGLGRVAITVQVDEDTTTVNGVQLFIYTMVK